MQLNICLVYHIINFLRSYEQRNCSSSLYIALISRRILLAEDAITDEVASEKFSVFWLAFAV